jgi:hypothetical protein
VGPLYVVHPKLAAVLATFLVVVRPCCTLMHQASLTQRPVPHWYQILLDLLASAQEGGCGNPAWGCTAGTEGLVTEGVPPSVVLAARCRPQAREPWQCHSVTHCLDDGGRIQSLARV